LFERVGTWSLAFYGSAVMALVAAVMALGLRALSAPAPEPEPALVGVSAPPE
jgi:hypothetical protein